MVASTGNTGPKTIRSSQEEPEVEIPRRQRKRNAMSVDETIPPSGIERTSAIGAETESGLYSPPKVSSGSLCSIHPSDRGKLFMDGFLLMEFE